MAVYLFRSCLARQFGNLRVGVLGISRHHLHTDDRKTPGVDKTEDPHRTQGTEDSSKSPESGHKAADQSYEDGGEYGVPDEEDENDVKNKILVAALGHVHTHGWTSSTIAAGAQSLGLSAMAEGMFPRGGGDLALFYIEDCNLRLADYLVEQTQALQESQDAPRPRSSVVIRDALETRLRMVIPYISTWPQAMQLMMRPENAPDALKNVAYMVDEIWYHAGDTSTDYNWYTKRAMLAALYGATEVYMVRDQSEDFTNTWAFLDNRIADIKEMAKMRDNFQKAGMDSTQLISAAMTTIRNMAGFNKRSR
ncbi:predicted protein [Nematostella vectensis]|uniref:Ubiquinone biosynthesis protein n=1 Tax=Nematostella vectensis TaxID=45351 RepID=A7SUS2_NEMVE|nr:predicted protein [Nematostella vectensis]|eukprot:XP_001624639.1 predicted protein [Nematostella vectensis]